MKLSTNQMKNPARWLFCLAAIGLIPLPQVDAQRSSMSADPSAKETQDAQMQPTEFLRVTMSESGEPESLQTAITRYRPAQGDLVVDLIGAVHIGEAAYYERLNEQFKNYDVVLYELVAPRGTRIPAGGKKESQGPLDLVSWMQQQAKHSLGLESQLEKIDYQPRNFIHADLSPTDMGKRMQDRGESPLTLGLSAMAEIMRQQNRAADSPELQQMASELSGTSLFELMNDPLKLKRLMASQFSRPGALESGLGESLNQLLVADRNQEAMRVLNRQIAEGKQKIAIFYGAAHMPDFESRLKTELGMSPTRQVWIDAWDLTRSHATPSSQTPAGMLMDLLNELGR